MAQTVRKSNTTSTKQSRRRTVEKVNAYDYSLLAIIVILSCFGLIMIYSTSAYTDGTTYFIRQTRISGACLLMAVIVSQFDYHLIIKLTPLLYVVSAILLIVTKYSGVLVNGARRWIKIGKIQFQPAEIAKIAIIVFLPYVIIKIGKKINGIKGTALIISLGLFLAGLTFIFTSNLSSAIIIAGITVIILFVAHPKTIPFAIVGAAGVILILIFIRYATENLEVFQNSDNYQMNRIYAWLNPEGSSSDEGYQIMQALYAVGSGGIFGKGLGNSAQKLGAVPESQNDMIFSIICEELGFFGAVLLIGLMLFMLYRLLVIAQNAPDLYGALMVTGIFAHIAIQVILNIGVVLNLFPPTGISLPFISYGGTSVAFLMAEMGLALSVSKQTKFAD